LLAGFFFAVARPGDVFLTGRAFYHGFASLAAAHGIRLRAVETSADNGHRLTADAIREAVRREPQAKALLFTSPTFTGEIYEEEEFAHLAAVIAETGLLVFCDMTFACTEHDGNFFRPTLAAFPDMEKQIVSVMSGSKRSVWQTRGSGGLAARARSFMQ
jgi:aspartate/methionine/tyrosine aminotransferase